MSHTAHSEPVAAVRRSLRLAGFEVAWIFLIFLLFAGSPPPDVGESHYLVKAKHYWQPDWCAGDLFLESRDAHETFYWTFGWVTRLCSLTAAAWIGRVVTWLLLAWSWQRLSWAIVPQPLVSLLSAGLMLLLVRNFHMAGEWIVGGVEAKGFAYVLVILALEAIVKNRWRAALLLAGAAGAFHILVGGWTAVAIGLAWLVTGKERPGFATLVPAAAGGLLLALPGLAPAIALNLGMPESVAREAARIYVFERLPHHLVFHRFREEYLARYGLLLTAWLALAWSVRNHPATRRLQLVAAGAVVIGLAGMAIDQGLVRWVNWTGQSADVYERAAASLLRYYWFRMSDSLVPVATALAMVFGLSRLPSARPALAGWLTVGATLLAAGNIADVCYWRARQRLPAAVLQPRPTFDSWPEWWLLPKHPRRPGELTAGQWLNDWQAVCDWINEQTPTDAKFLTPREQQTFKWYAGRAEVATWKDIPQDARGLVQWKRTVNELYPRDLPHRQHDLAAFSDAELVALARKYGATHILIDRTRATRPIGLPRVYPLVREENPSFDVYRVPEMKSP